MDLDKKFYENTSKNLENSAEMSRQYREMQTSFNERILDLEDQV